MQTNITLIAKFKVHQGKQQEMKNIYDEAMDMVKNSEPDTLSFTLYTAQDESVFVSYEVYKNSEAILENFKLAQSRIQRVIASSDVISCDIYGDVSQEVVDLLSPYATQFYSYDRGYKRS